MRIEILSLLFAIVLGETLGSAIGFAGDSNCHLTSVQLTTPFAITKERSELSGVVFLSDRLIALSNEAIDTDEREFALQIFKGNLLDGYSWKRDAPLYNAEGECKQADFEGLTHHDGHFYAIGSHSRDRKKQKLERTYAQNRQRLTEEKIEYCDARHHLMSFRLDQEGNVSDVEDVSLEKLIADSPYLRPFAGIPDKENGVDIEGLAATDEGLFVGFRGPVLRQNYVPVLRLGLDLSNFSLEASETLFVDLEGRGIRDLTGAPGGFYVLAGPNGDEPQTFAVYFWDGKDQIAGSDRPSVPKPDKRCDLGTYLSSKPEGISSKPEGIAYVGRDGSAEQVLLAFDSDVGLRVEILNIEGPP